MFRFGAGACVAAATVLLLVGTVFSRNPAVPNEQICDVAADAALGSENYPLAMALHRHLLHSHPDDAVAHYHLGFAYGMVGNRAGEIDEYRKAVALGLQNWDLFLNLGLAYFEARDSSHAAAALEHAVQLGPERPEAHFNLALVYESKNMLSNAFKEITVAQRLDPEDHDVENTRGIVCAEIGDLGCARDVWTHLAQAGYSPALANLAILGQPGKRHQPFRTIPTDARTN